MTAVEKIATSLLFFLNQKDDFETKKVLAQLLKLNDLENIDIAPIQSAFIPVIHEPVKQVTIQAATKQVEATPKQVISSIYARLVDKVKKACPDLRIKPSSDVRKITVPDCDVLMLLQNNIADVYQSLAKAIDKQLGLTEIILLTSDLIPDILTKNFKLILIPELLKKSALLESYLKPQPMTGDIYLGSSLVIFLDEPEILINHISKKQHLWQMIKKRFA